MESPVSVAVVGAGPYGLSLAAHLAETGIDFRIFGRPMESWLRHMPKGMLLKSEPFASNLADPEDHFTLERYCDERSVPNSERSPVRLETFCDYALAFQKLYAFRLENTQVTSIERAGALFLLRLENGATATARRVVLALGVGPFQYLPEVLSALPRGAVSHSFNCNDLSVFKRARVAVIGGGSSAIDVAALLREQGSDVRLISRRASLKFSGTAPETETRPSLWRRLRHPQSGLGPGLRSRFSTDAPLLIHALPKKLRLEFSRRHLGPGASGVMKDRLVGKVPVLLERELVAAASENGEVALTLRKRDGQKSETEIVRVDHVIAATGFRTDVRRLELLSPSLRTQISAFEHTPILNSSFESSVPGLYFIGSAAAPNFGPLLRFAFGARFAARRVSLALIRSLRRPEATSARARAFAIASTKRA
jgi:cation diffusion facilitator CzcD-associated flavoprotein CzcO